jgi:hypothetical protein
MRSDTIKFISDHRGACIRALVIAATGVTLAACADSNVPFFTAPVSVPNSSAGIQNSVSGLFSAIRFDAGDYVIEVAAGYARDGSVFTNTEARTVEYPLGVFPEPSSWANDWPQEYQNISQANATLVAIPKVLPAYTAPQAEAVWGVVETLKAMNYMILAETHDTLGVDIQPYPDVSPPTLPPAVCLQDGWKYIVSMLDSAQDSLAAAGSTMPVTMPKGFAGVSGAAGPSTKLGTFASFNRIIAAKANLELAYAIARSTAGTSPSPTSAGTPDAASLAAALTALNASAMWDPTGASLVQNSPGTFSADARDVLFDFSAVSGDQINPIFNQIGTIAQLNDFTADVDTVNDLRWKAKFITNPNPVQQQLYNPVATITKSIGGQEVTWSYLYNMSATPSSSIPIAREESMTFWAAEIQLAMGNYAQALAYVNNVRTKVGGLTAYPASDATGGNAYEQVRADLMADQRISTTWEASLDRVIAIRMYGLAAVADTTWGVNGVLPHGGTEDAGVKVTDSHTTVEPIPSAELNGRGGTYTTSCPAMTVF